jgi:subtilisin family serine protease
MKKHLISAAVCAALMTTAVSASAASYIVLGNGSNLDAAVSAAGGKITNRLPAVNAVVAESSSKAFASKVGKAAGVQSVMPNLTIDWYGGTKRADETVTADFANPPNSGDDDTRFNLQWGHDAVNAVEAWNAGYRGAGARVAVLDGGFNPSHPDIAPNFDASCSADFTGEGLEYGPNSDDPTGIFSHGMHVAGTIAAADNALGTIGVAPEASLCLVKVLFNYGSGSFEDVVEGIVWAADQGVDVINMSLGGALYKAGVPGEYTAREAAELKNFVGRAVTYAHQRGVLVIASAGNDAIDGDKDGALIHLPSDAPHAVSISATAPIGWGKDPTVTLDNPASYTNYGRSVIGLAAPGGDFQYAFVDPSAACTVGGLTRVCYVFDYVFSTGGVVGSTIYYYWSVGTSMAAPHASGVAALAVSRYGKLKPAQLRTILERGADDLGQPGNDPFYGAGRVNAENSTK